MNEDRSMTVRPEQTVQVHWVRIDQCILGSRVPMSPEAVEKKWRQLLNIGDGNASWPPIVGHWAASSFVIDDGRHEYVARLMRGEERILACWLVTPLQSAGRILSEGS